FSNGRPEPRRAPDPKKAAGARAAWSVMSRLLSYDHAARVTLGRARRQAGASQKADVDGSGNSSLTMAWCHTPTISLRFSPSTATDSGR
ncbi:MAG: hypothetical protein PVG53_09950, partial [Holophagae bacterium]